MSTLNPGVHFFHTGVRRRKYKLGQTKQNPSNGGLWDVSAPGVRSFGYGAIRFKSSHRTGSFKMKRFEIFCSDPFTHQPGEWPERYAAPRASLDVAVRADTKQTTPRGLGAAVSGFGGPCTLPLRRRRCDARAQERSR
jgi:hypothetical protein